MLHYFTSVRYTAGMNNDLIPERNRSVIILSLVIYPVIAVLIIWGVERAWGSNNKRVSTPPICHKEDIPYDTHVTYSASDDADYRFATVDGQYGTREICTRDGVVISNNVTLQPVTEEVLQGTYVAPAPSGCAVTLCADGTCSYSTGRGTCSWHGGEAY